MGSRYAGYSSGYRYRGRSRVERPRGRVGDVPSASASTSLVPSPPTPNCKSVGYSGTGSALIANGSAMLRGALAPKTALRSACNSSFAT